MNKIGVIGAGSWGTTVAALIAEQAETVLWARRDELAVAINQDHINSDYLPGHKLPDRLRATNDLGEAIEKVGAVVMAVPSHGFRSVFAELAGGVADSTPIVSLTKGIEEGSLATMSEIVAELAPDRDPGLTGVLTGPNLATEVAAGQPAASVIAFSDEAVARRLQELLMRPTFRVYTNDDVSGCELGGAVKNVMAIASGMSDGLGFGDNTRATLLTRALAEVTRLGVARGGHPETFAGLAGMGDLIATCSSEHSRNHRVGVGLARGKSLEEIISEMRMVAEGVKTTRGTLGLAERLGVEMPIAGHVQMVLDGELSPREGMLALMTRQARSEI